MATMDEYLRKIAQEWDAPKPDADYRKITEIMDDFFSKVKQKPEEILSDPILMAKVSILLTSGVFSTDFMLGYITCYLTDRLEGK